jgi:hypothetical protein
MACLFVVVWRQRQQMVVFEKKCRLRGGIADFASFPQASAVFFFVDLLELPCERHDAEFLLGMPDF